MSKVGILEILKEHPAGLTARQIHSKLNLVNVHHQLKQLVDDGKLEQELGYSENCIGCGHLIRGSTWRLVV